MRHRAAGELLQPTSFNLTGKIMTKIRYLTTRTNAAGQVRYYWQPSRDLQKQGWALRRLSDNPQEAMREALEANARLDGQRLTTGSAKLKPAKGHTLGALCVQYQKGPGWASLAANTRQAYDLAMRALVAWAGQRLVADITRQDIRKFLLTRTPASTGAARARVLHLLLEQARNEGWLITNPASRLGLARPAPRQALWTASQVNQLVARADELGLPHLGTAALLGFWLGQRCGDVLALTAADYQPASGAFTLRQAKTGRLVTAYVPPLVQARLIGLESQGGAIVRPQGYGGQYCQRSFRAEFSGLVEAVFPGSGLQFRDLRRGAAVDMGESGCTEAQLAAVGGWQIETSRAILETYLPRTAEMAAAAMAKRLSHHATKEQMQ